jgi:hypothetical protein
MKLPLCILWLLMTLNGLTQRYQQNFRIVDNYVEEIKPAAPAILAQQLTTPFTTELEKVRAIFRWISNNIDYRIREFQPKFKSRPAGEVDDDTAALKPLDERVAEEVINNKVAVCDGYARLFKTLCRYAGIESELITGYARTEAHKVNRRFRSNHTWNAVKIDNAWHLLDVTWASGYVTWRGSMFIRYFDEEYFLSPPQQFIREHYPDDLRWSLMTDPPLMAEFRHSPYKQRTFIKYSIKAFRPAKGVIEVQLGDTIQIELDVSDPERDSRIGADPFLDTSIYNTINSVLLVPDKTLPHRTTYFYTVDSPKIEWLYVLYNDDVVLRYRLLVGRKLALQN